MDEQSKENIRQLVRDEITKQVNTKPDSQVDESYKANAVRAAFFSLGTIGALAGAVGGMAAGNASLGLGSIFGGATLFGVGEAIARKVADKEFNAHFKELQCAVAERDKIINKATLEGNPDAAEDYIQQHSMEVKRLTKDQQKAARKMRKYIKKQNTSSDAMRILGGLTKRDRQYLEDLIEKAESGLMTTVDVR